MIYLRSCLQLILAGPENLCEDRVHVVALGQLFITGCSVPITAEATRVLFNITRGANLGVEYYCKVAAGSIGFSPSFGLDTPIGHSWFSSL